MHTTAPTAPNTLERHIADSMAAADDFDAKAMQALTDGDHTAADEHWTTASLLRVSACMLEQLVGAGALAVLR
jgi:hypothetical protein